MPCDGVQFDMDDGNAAELKVVAGAAAPHKQADARRRRAIEHSPHAGRPAQTSWRRRRGGSMQAEANAAFEACRRFEASWNRETREHLDQRPAEKCKARDRGAGCSLCTAQDHAIWRTLYDLAEAQRVAAGRIARSKVNRGSTIVPGQALGTG